MVHNGASELITTLERAKSELMRSSQSAGATGDWDRAQRHLQWARDVDGMIVALNQDGQVSGLTRNLALTPPPRPRQKFPHYYTQNNKLVKVGSGRDGITTYEHRVTREHYDLMIGHLVAMAEDGTFDTSDLVKRCDVPVHEPRIVLAVLEKEHLLDSTRRGRWRFKSPETFGSDVQRVWRALPQM